MREHLRKPSMMERLLGEAFMLAASKSVASQWHQDDVQK
jgi:hypothetical protein